MEKNADENMIKKAYRFRIERREMKMRMERGKERRERARQGAPVRAEQSCRGLV